MKKDWISIEEKLPRIGQEVLTVTEDGWYRVLELGSLGHGKFPSQVTHWMELPKLPQQ